MSCNKKGCHKRKDKKGHQKKGHHGGSCGKGCPWCAARSNKVDRFAKTDDCCDPTCTSLGFIDHPNTGYFRNIELCQSDVKMSSAEFTDNVEGGRDLCVGCDADVGGTLKVEGNLGVWGEIRGAKKISGKRVVAKDVLAGNLYVTKIHDTPDGLPKGAVWSHNGRLRIKE